MTEVNVAELRRALEAPSQYWVYPQFGGPPVSTDSPFVCVNRSTLTALLDAYEQQQEIARREAALKAHPDYEEATQDAQRFRDLTKLPGYSMGYEAGYGEAQKANPLPGSYLRIIQQVLDRVLAGEPAAQVVRDWPDEYGYTIEGLERVERLLKFARTGDAVDRALALLEEATDA